MKRVPFLFILFLIHVVMFSQKQFLENVEIIKIDKSKISADMASIRCHYKFVQQITANMQASQQEDTLTLDVGAKASHYYDIARAKRDSLFGDFMSNKLNAATIQSISVLKDEAMSSFDSSVGTTYEFSTKGETAHLYKKRQTGEIIIIEKSDDSPNKYRCIDKIIPKWNIEADTLTVLGYICQKATTEFRGRTYEAWFAADIPINDGPWKLYGLPGLILKARDIENIFSFEIIGLEKLNPPVDIILAKDDYMDVSRKDLAKIKKKQKGGMAINVNGGNIVIGQRKNINEYASLETE